MSTNRPENTEDFVTAPPTRTPCPIAPELSVEEIEAALLSGMTGFQGGDCPCFECAKMRTAFVLGWQHARREAARHEGGEPV